jgi:hypothetical protein
LSGVGEITPVKRTSVTGHVAKSFSELKLKNSSNEISEETLISINEG